MEHRWLPTRQLLSALCPKASAPRSWASTSGSIAGAGENNASEQSGRPGSCWAGVLLGWGPPGPRSCWAVSASFYSCKPTGVTAPWLCSVLAKVMDSEAHS